MGASAVLGTSPLGPTRTAGCNEVRMEAGYEPGSPHEGCDVQLELCGIETARTY